MNLIEGWKENFKIFEVRKSLWYLVNGSLEKRVKDVTGQTPEFIIMIPKGEAAASKQLQNLLREVKNAGFKAEYIELKATNSAFEDAARRIVDKAKQGG